MERLLNLEDGLRSAPSAPSRHVRVRARVPVKLWRKGRIRSMMMSRTVSLLIVVDCKTIQLVQNQHDMTSSEGIGPKFHS